MAGIAYSILAVVALTRISSYPSLDLSEPELTAWFDDDTNQALLVGALGLVSVSAIAFLWFVAVVRRRLGERDDRFLATVFFGSGITYVAVWLVGAAVLAGPAVAVTMLDAAEVSPAAASLAGGVGAALLLVAALRIEAVFSVMPSAALFGLGSRGPASSGSHGDACASESVGDVLGVDSELVSDVVQ